MVIIRIEHRVVGRNGDHDILAIDAHLAAELVGAISEGAVEGGDVGAVNDEAEPLLPRTQRRLDALGVDAVYVEVETGKIVGIQPKPPFKLLFTEVCDDLGFEIL